MRSNREPPERSGCICRSASRSCPATASSSASRVRVSRSAAARSSTSIRSFRRRGEPDRDVERVVRERAASTSTTCADSPANSERPTSAGGRSIPPPWRHRRRTPQGRGGRRGSRTRDCSTRRVRASRARGARRHHHRWGTGPGRRLDRRLGRQRSGRPARSRSVCAAGARRRRPGRDSRTRPPRRACRKVVWSSQRAPSTRRPGSWLGCWPTNPTESPSPRPAMRGAPRAVRDPVDPDSTRRA